MPDYAISKIYKIVCNVTNLVYFEVHNDIKEAIVREKQIKIWKRQWKFFRIEHRKFQLPS